MKYILSVFFCLISMIPIEAKSIEQDRTLYRCSGYSSDRVVDPDITVSILEKRGQFSVVIKIADREELKMSVELKELKEDDFSYYDTFFNKDKDVQVEVFLDDMGSMSSLQLRGQKFVLTCGWVSF